LPSDCGENETEALRKKERKKEEKYKRLRIYA
jgi:hypothetical protein